MNGAYGRVGSLGGPGWGAPGWGDANSQNAGAASANQQAEGGGSGGGGAWAWLGTALEKGVEIVKTVGNSAGGQGGQVLTSPSGTPTSPAYKTGDQRTLGYRGGTTTTSPTSASSTSMSWWPWLLGGVVVVGGVYLAKRR